MDKDNEKVSATEDVKVPESPKPLAFTIDFGDGKSVDTQKHKSLLEKYQKRHRRGQSLSKLEDPVTTATVKKHPLSVNLPRKSSFQSEGYFSSDERIERNKNVRASAISIKLKDSLNLPLRNVTTDKMTQSCTLPSITSPEIELKDVSSPELDLVSPYSPRQQKLTPSPTITKSKIVRQYSSPECESKKIVDSSADCQFVDGAEFDFDKSDTVSDAGTYTLDADNYSEEQKARMSIDREFKIEQVSVLKKAEDYVRSLTNLKEKSKGAISSKKTSQTDSIVQKSSDNEWPCVVVVQPILDKPRTLDFISNAQKNTQRTFEQKHRVLSPILSPTQNLSITQTKPVKEESKQMNNGEDDVHNKTFTKILFPSPKARTGIGSEPALDQGSVISVTSSGAFRSKSDRERRHARQLSLTKSEVHVEAYTDNSYQKESVLHAALTLNKPNGANLTANVNVIHLAESLPKPKNYDDRSHTEVFNTESDVGIVHANITLSKITNLPPAVGGLSGKTSPTKIPSPIHSSRPRSRNSISSLNIDLSDSSLETESYLKPTQTIINTLQQRLSLDSDRDSEIETKYLNNDARNILKKPSHLRHNSFDDRSLKISNKLEHFQNKNLQGIDQTYTNMLNQYTHRVNKIQNSPNNSPIRRSSSFSTKNQINTKNSNLHQKETNILNSPNLNRNGSIQRSASTANIKPNLLQFRRSSISSDHPKIDRNQFGDTESSSEEDYDKNLQKKKDITNTRYNRAFSLRRARLDVEPTQPKCPNTPEMRRKFQPCDIRSERAISVDRKPIKTNDVQSRYLQNITKKNLPPSKPENPKSVPRIGSAGSKPSSNKSQVFSRTDTGRFSMRTTKPPVSNVPKNVRKDSGKKQSGGRSNSSLSSREVEFQNWKRRKSYDPMKAAAEGKRKAELAKRQNSMTQSYTEANQDCDSSPSHSSSVHRSQSFHGTAALEQLISSDEDDLTLSADEGFSPPTPSPCELSPARASLRYAWKDQIMH